MARCITAAETTSTLDHLRGGIVATTMRTRTSSIVATIDHDARPADSPGSTSTFPDGLYVTYSRAVRDDGVWTTMASKDSWW